MTAAYHNAPRMPAYRAACLHLKVRRRTPHCAAVRMRVSCHFSD